MSEFFELKGKTIVKIDIGDETYIDTDDGKRYKMFHDQDCCESVGFVKSIGEVCNILNSPVTLAEEDYNENDPAWFNLEESYHRHRESYTWSSYFLETTNGRLELWYLGSSNGYYSEVMKFVEI